MVLTVGLLCSVIGGITWQNFFFFLAIRIRLSLAKTSLRLANNMQSQASCCSFISSGSWAGIGGSQPTRWNQIFSFLFYSTSTQPSTQPPTPFTTPSLSVTPPPGAELDPPGLVILQEIPLFCIPPSQSLP